MNQPILRHAIIGCGVIAPTHAECFKALPGVELAWACDLVPDKAAALAARFGIPRTTADYRELLADPALDSVSICTDHGSHAELAVAALRAGKHVLCEKALAASPAGMDAMLAAHAANPGRVFAGVFQHRFDAINRCLKRLAGDGTLGTLLTATMQCRCLRTDAYYQADAWRGTWAGEGGSVLINQAIHFVDILNWIAGPAESLYGVHANRTHAGVIETEDTAVIAVRFASGALGTIEATCSSHMEWDSVLALHGSRGSVEVRNGRPVTVTLADPAAQEAVRSELAACGEHHAVPVGKDYYGDGHGAQIADFVAAIREGREPFIPAREARQAVDIVLAAYESQRTGGRVTLRQP